MRLSCLVRISGVNTIADKTRQFCLVSTQFPICNCSVSNISRITENLEIGNWVETRQNCVVLSAVVFTPLTRTRQDSLVVSVSAVWTSYITLRVTVTDLTVKLMPAEFRQATQLHSYCKILNVRVPLILQVSQAKQNCEFNGCEYQLQAKIGQNYYSILLYGLNSPKWKGQIIVHAKSPTFWAAKLKGFTVTRSQWVMHWSMQISHHSKQLRILRTVTFSCDDLITFDEQINTVTHPQWTKPSNCQYESNAVSFSFRVTLRRHEGVRWTGTKQSSEGG